jgi:hypothetical protein
MFLKKVWLMLSTNAFANGTSEAAMLFQGLAIISNTPESSS